MTSYLTSASPAPAIVGHRGAMGTEPENTVRSFRRAVRDGADAIELDLYLSADGALVICHDATVDRTTDGSGPIAELTLAELKELDAGEGERIPTFDEVLDCVDGAAVQAEVKAAGAMPLLAETVRERGLVGQVTVTSFHLEMIEEARRLIPDVPRGLIFNGMPDDAIDKARGVEASLLCPGLTALSARAVAACREAGLQVCGWVANDEEAYELARALRLDWVTSDYPGKLKAARGGAVRPPESPSTA